MKKILYLFLCLVFFAGCKEEEKLDVVVQYQVRMPSPLMEVADAYVTYYDNGQPVSEKIAGLEYNKKLQYSFDKDQLKSPIIDFSRFKVILKLRVPSSELKEGAKLLDDENAFYRVSFVGAYTHEKNNYFTNSASAESKAIDVAHKFTYDEKVRDYAYSVDEQMDIFSNQESKPWFNFTCDLVNTTIKYSADFNMFQNETRSSNQMTHLFD